MSRLSVPAQGIIADTDRYQQLKTAQHAEVLLLSDTHGAVSAVKWLFSYRAQRAQPFDACLFAGDGTEDLLQAVEAAGVSNSEESIPPLLVFARGNGDAAQYPLPQQAAGTQDRLSIPFYQTIHIANEAILLTHGHLCCVDFTLDRLCDAAAQAHCKIAVHGHTHIQAYTRKYNTVCINPGSPIRPRGKSPAGFAILKLDSDKSGKRTKTLEFYTLHQNSSGEFCAEAGNTYTI